MKTAEIRKRWLDFFAKNGHTVVPSASLISDDPSLMFTVAGMVPFVPYLTGVVPAPYKRATSVQKCIRTNDIEEVGKTPRHGTFFQMNGNFSFGDYFKAEAIRYAWEFLTLPEKDGGLGFDPKDLWVTVYKEDLESEKIWREVSKLPLERIQRLDKDTNYWSTGQSGPAGPCSEIFYDRGPAYGVDGGPATDDDRYVEIWNLVFMQYLINDVKSKTEFNILGELPQKNIDTGMGLERVAFIKQGVENMYEIDEVRPVLDKAAQLANVNYGDNLQVDIHLRVIADHIRSSLMLMTDGVMPSNDGRGYILRRLMRRAIRSLRLLGVEEEVFPQLFAISIDAMSASYPEIIESYSKIERQIIAEEKTFLRTLKSGTTILDTAIEQTKNSNNNSLAGDTAFLLHDTYGFPIELTEEIVNESGLKINYDTFKELMQAQKERAKADAKAKKSAQASVEVYSEYRKKGESKFLGYETLESDAKVIGIIKDGVSVKSAKIGSTVEVILDQSPFWAESGGQDADQGSIISKNFTAEIIDVQKPVAGLISHTAIINDGEISLEENVIAQVDANYRFGATQAHSATHIIHAALRHTLGSDAHQTGSYNKAGYMRLDFNWSEPLGQETRSEIEDIANNAIAESLAVETRQMSLDQAKELGAMALFGEKYGDKVRVVDIGGEWSRELCAGTHVSNSSQISLVNFVSEQSVGSTNRRVEFLVGKDAFKSFAAERAIINELSASLKTPKPKLLDRVYELSNQLKQAEKKIADMQNKSVMEKFDEIIKSERKINDLSVFAHNFGSLSDADSVRNLAMRIKNNFANNKVAIVMAADIDNKPVIVVAVTKKAQEAGVHAGQLVKTAATILGGGGGGKAEFAQGGGVSSEKISDAITAILNELRDSL